ncbi:MAG: hypothetical protein COY68_04555 [Candidatus Levybacteria bacterium CG_4_10_14_0_8_um_filter_35_23]|nr:MAG: hypothetical protein COY68_04555 [Candidatus Levybacteria bacterium CG_4_10_14_0_8_um_filter_35_23]
MILVKKTFLFLILATILLFCTKSIWAQTVTPTPTPAQDKLQQSKELQDKINELQKKVSDLQGQTKTLSSQIAVMDNQIKLSEYRIDSTKTELLSLSADIDTADKKIGVLEKNLSGLTKVLINRIVATYEVGGTQSFEALVASNNISNFFTRFNYLKIAQIHDKKLIYDTQQAKMDYANQKNIFENEKKKVESLKKQLEDYTIQLDREKQGKQRLLAETQGNETTYQRLLNQAKAQLAGFSRFVTSQGGASILSGQTVCDDWGCYYNQRDSQWGNSSLNGTQYTLASDGCLVTSMAMVYTHLGHRDVTPLTINSNSSNFASYYPAYLNKTISADGMTTSRISSSIDGELSAGRPVIVGIGLGPDHFVVLVSGSGGNYIMNDPFVSNGHNINFTDHYSLSNIKTIEKISY